VWIELAAKRRQLGFVRYGPGPQRILLLRLHIPVRLHCEVARAPAYVDREGADSAPNRDAHPPTICPPAAWRAQLARAVAARPSMYERGNTQVAISSNDASLLR
jgi:hypothetical protein